ncbi:MAG TPA: hypothetical protein VD862_03150 [Candidatus Paceibacterota bacterium]|nr:hypothetical protein [Candidatus Paceibacterota bacterium]
MERLKKWLREEGKKLAVILALGHTPLVGGLGLFAFYGGLRAGWSRPGECMVHILMGIMLFWAARNMYRFWDRNTGTGDKAVWGASALTTAFIMAWAVPSGGLTVISIGGIFGCWGGVMLYRQFRLWRRSRRPAA